MSPQPALSLSCRWKCSFVQAEIQMVAGKLAAIELPSHMQTFGTKLIYHPTIPLVQTHCRLSHT